MTHFKSWLVSACLLVFVAFPAMGQELTISTLAGSADALVPQGASTNSHVHGQFEHEHSTNQIFSIGQEVWWNGVLYRNEACQLSHPSSCMGSFDSQGNIVLGGTIHWRRISSGSAGTLQFSASSASVAENGGSVTLTVTRTGGSSGAASVNYATIDNTARAGSEYTAKSGTTNWSAGNSASKTITITILDDSIDDADANFAVELSGASGASLGMPWGTDVMILDNESPQTPGTLQFSASSASVNENGGSVTLTVTRSGGSSGAASVNYATAPDTASAGSDYTSRSGTTNWSSGDSASKTITVSITDDSIDEVDETFRVNLSGASGASLGTPISVTVKIVDNETPSVFTPTFSPEGGVYGDPLFVTVRCATAGAVMHYTTDGTDPTESDLPLFSGERVWIEHTTTLKAKAWKSGMTTSEVASATYSLPLEVVISVENGWRDLYSGVELTLRATVQNEAAPVSYYSWDLGDPVPNSTSATNTATPRAQYYVGSRRISVTVTGGTATATAYYQLTVNRPLVPNEPPVAQPLADVVDGTAVGSNGNEVDLSQSGGRDGLIVLIHGTESSGTADWLQDLQIAISIGLANSQYHPDIVRWDWAEMANPVNRPIQAADLIGDLLRVRPNGILQGVLLAEWIREQAIAGNIDTSKPIHLIGHSAGGFVAGECARVLKALNLDIITQVTMLDTPCPVRSHFDEYPTPHRVERYVSSAFGATILDFRTSGDMSIAQLGDQYLDDISQAWESYFPPWVIYLLTWEQARSIPLIPAAGNYYRKEIPQGSQLEATVDAHGHAITWYEGSCFAGSDGFSRSPFLRSSLLRTETSDLGRSRTLRARSDAIDGFSTFGNVTLSGDAYTITEGEGNAGIFKSMEFPSRVKSVSFNYRFTSAGDGDYLGVYVGTNNGLFIGPDVQMTRDNNVQGSVEVGFAGGSTEQLIFKLISRGSQNAQVTISAIELAVEGSLVSGDYDGDGVSDLAVFDSNTGYWYIRTVSGSLIAWDAQWGWPGAVPVSGDYDGDGISDLAVFDGNTGYWYIRSASGTTLAWQVQWGWPGAVPVSGDYDGDGISDLGIFDSNTGYWYVNSLSGSALVWQVQWGWPGAVAVAGDYDGDGIGDLAVFDSNTGYWYIRTVSGTTLGWAGPCGGPGAVPVSGDYDGDGISDLAAFDSNTGYWSVYSLSGAVLAGQVAWGWSGAVAVGGDYDGDGVSDLAVFDGNTGAWYIRTVSGTTLVWGVAWGWPGAIPVGSGSATITASASPSGFVLIPAGSFTMGDTFGEGNPNELPTHLVNISAFYMEVTEVTKAQWDTVYVWAVSHGYSFENAGSGKASTHPVQWVNWYDCVKWCNARSEKDGLTPCYYTTSGKTTIYRSGNTDISSNCVNWSANGYRLPTEAEWEKAARGGVSGHRFAWSDANTISHDRANFRNSGGENYATGTTGYHPAYATGGYPYTSPVGSFAANGYGLYDMAGNVWEWCWDWYGSVWYSDSGATTADTCGPPLELVSLRVGRGGLWNLNAYDSRSANRGYGRPIDEGADLGFRCARSQ